MAVVRNLGRHGACSARGLWKFCCLFTDRLARFCRLFSERLLRWRDGSICCAVSHRYRNASRLFHKTLSAFCCARGRVRSAPRPQGGGAPGRGEQARIRSNVRRRAGTRTSHLYQLGCLFGRHGARRLGRMGRVPARRRRSQRAASGMFAGRSHCRNLSVSINGTSPMLAPLARAALRSSTSGERSHRSD
jgi:hypothetical protein